MMRLLHRYVDIQKDFFIDLCFNICNKSYVNY